MATAPLLDAKVFIGGYDMSGDHNSLALKLERTLVDKTSFGSTGARSKALGMRNLTGDHSGFWDSGTGEPDSVLQLASTEDIMTWAASGAAGDTAYSFKSVRASYEWGGEIDTMNAFSGTLEGSGLAIRGTILEPGSTARTASGNTASIALGSVASGKSVYASLHVLSASGTTPTLDVKVQSDDASGFASPVDRITFSQATDIGAQWGTAAAGPITDTFWRINYTIGGTSPSFAFAVVVAIQ